MSSGPAENEMSPIPREIDQGISTSSEKIQKSEHGRFISYCTQFYLSTTKNDIEVNQDSKEPDHEKKEEEAVVSKENSEGEPKDSMVPDHDKKEPDHEKKEGESVLNKAILKFSTVIVEDETELEQREIAMQNDELQASQKSEESSQKTTRYKMVARRTLLLQRGKRTLLLAPVAPKGKKGTPTSPSAPKGKKGTPTSPAVAKRKKGTSAPVAAKGKRGTLAAPAAPKEEKSYRSG
ncbi:FK506-binding protein 4-like [Chenopodium quinoa]|uniref:FK506-binding protein 4-like n=1 Tax=Chenopodium quinoa TaxID=63459 RepID=UPI000B78CF61|nr:FK506-binding protein 4-like [Chenopodium quinoa]